MSKATAVSPCPCGSEQTLNKCCGPYIQGEKKAPTAEALMRSRYTAYTLHEVDYIERTHDPKSIHEFDKETALKWATSVEWLGLEIKDTKDGSENDDSGTVEFIASFKVGDETVKHHELSLFRHAEDDSAWYYVDGKTVRTPIVRNSPKVGRNDPCTCGSGKKYKKCCAIA